MCGAYRRVAAGSEGLDLKQDTRSAADRKPRSKWLERLQEAFNDDGVGYLDVLGERGPQVPSYRNRHKWPHPATSPRSGGMKAPFSHKYNLLWFES
jgi:hypothetical protein